MDCSAEGISGVGETAVDGETGSCETAVGGKRRMKKPSLRFIIPGLIYFHWLYGSFF